jgi:hypothetical protein
MPIAQGATAVTAGAINSNVLSGEAVEFVERPSRVRVFITAEAAGESRAQFSISSRIVLVESPVSRQNRPPLVPDDLLLEEIAMPGERLILRLRNTGAGTNTVFWRVEAMPVA